MDDMPEIKKSGSDEKSGSGESTIAASTQFKGKISGIESLHVLGRIEGEVKSEKSVRIHKGGTIKGDIECRRVIISGKLIGTIKAADHVEIRPEAHVTGNIQTDKIAIAEGSFFKGEIHTHQSPDKSIRFMDKRQTKLIKKDQENV